MRLPERILEHNRASTKVDEFYPKKLMDELIAHEALALLETFVEGNNSLSDERYAKLERHLWVKKELVLLAMPQPSPPPSPPSPSSPSLCGRSSMI